MIDLKNCTHEDVYFGSGDHYIFCSGCGRKWLTADADDKVPGPSNLGAGTYLSGQHRTGQQ
jgi:hypothetical protein